MTGRSSRQQWAMECSEPVVSPSGEYNVVVSSQTFGSGDASSQAIVSGPRGGAGLISFPAARVSMRFEWCCVARPVTGLVAAEMARLAWRSVPGSARPGVTVFRNG